MESLRGQFLIASGRLADPNFSKTVTLIVQHDQNGALGLIVNRPMEITVKQVCEQVLETTCEIDAVLHRGGPCEDHLILLHSNISAGEVEVLPGVYFTSGRGRIAQLLQSPPERMKFFVGYSGWAPGQLEAEFDSGSWLNTRAALEDIFTPGEKIWSKLSTRLTLGQWVNPEQIPDDPSMN